MHERTEGLRWWLVAVAGVTVLVALGLWRLDDNDAPFTAAGPAPDEAPDLPEVMGPEVLVPEVMGPEVLVLVEDAGSQSTGDRCRLDGQGRPLVDAPMPGDWLNECGVGGPDRAPFLEVELPEVELLEIEQVIAEDWVARGAPEEFVGLCRPDDDRVGVWCATEIYYLVDDDPSVRSFGFLRPRDFDPSVVGPGGTVFVGGDFGGGVLVVQVAGAWTVVDVWSAG